ncbi:MAG: hypothetical protein ACD_48C00319G0002, partial [uncultured bacterium]
IFIWRFIKTYISLWFFLVFAMAMFLFEFLIESDVYWGSLSVNQWLYVGIIGQAIGAFYVKYGGKEKLKMVIGGIYGKFSKRYFRKHTGSV